MLGLIGGTALEHLALENARKCLVDTPWGSPSGPLTLGRFGSKDIVWLNRHGEHHTIPPHRVNYRANIAALAGQGVQGIIAINAVGGITPAMVVGTLVLPHQLIDYTWGRTQSFFDRDDEQVIPVDFTQPYDEGLRRRLLDVAGAAGIDLVDGAVHGVVQGPRLETAAEILRMERDGCDLVGMTGMPEAGLAREKGIPYVSLGMVVNPAAGKNEEPITLDYIGRVLAGATPRLMALLEAFCR